MDLMQQRLAVCAEAWLDCSQSRVGHLIGSRCYYRSIEVKILSKALGHTDVNTTYNINISLKGGADKMHTALYA